MVNLTRDVSTPENRAHWAFVHATAKAVREWPAWKAGLSDPSRPNATVGDILGRSMTQLPLPFTLNPTTNLYESLVPIPSEPGLWAGHLGGIYSTRGRHSPRYLSQLPKGGKRTRGYLSIKCRTRREEPPYPSRRLFVHTLIAEAYHGPRPSPTHEIDHIDGDNWNNAAANLQYLTPEEHRTKPTMTVEDWDAIL